MKRFLLLLFIFFNSLAAWAQMFDLPQPQQFKWFGDWNWSLSGNYNNERGGAIGTPFSLVPDVSSSGKIQYQFTAGVGGGYRADQIIWWAKKKKTLFHAYMAYQTLWMPMQLEQDMFDSREDAMAAVEKWNEAAALEIAMGGGLLMYDANIQSVA